MSIIKTLVKEMEQEAQTTRKMLSRIPNNQYQFKPHEKSMRLDALATHIAELPTWVPMILNTTELDFAAALYEPKYVGSTAELLELFEKSLAEGKAALEQATESDLEPTWTLRNGEQILSESSRGEFTRLTFCQIVHHRAQLGVYLRLLNIPIPGSYGPSADEMSFS